MSLKILVAAATLALAATGASAFVSPGAKVGQQGNNLIQVVDAKKNVQVKRAPVVQRRAVVAHKPVAKVHVQAKKTVAVIKKPVVVTKQPISKTVTKTVVKTPIAKQTFVNGKPVAKLQPKYVHVKNFRKHKYYGRTIGGVVLGSILAASAYYAYAYASPPDDSLCWYWTNSDRERGYWDYCVAPDDDE